MTTHRNNKGFVLGMVLMVCLLMATFIFSYNTLVRRANIQAHHAMISQTAAQLAISGANIVSDGLAKMEPGVLRARLPELFDLDFADDTLTITTGIAEDFRADYQRMLNQAEELKASQFIGTSLGREYPQVTSIEIVFSSIMPISPDLDAAQLQAGRDPLEKFGKLTVYCTINYRGLSRRAEVSRQFRLVSMIPAPYSRFSLFVSQTPDANSYNSMGVHITGAPHASPVSGNVYSSGLRIFNGTGTEDVFDTDNRLRNKDRDLDEKHLEENGWIFIGPTRAGEPVMLNLPAGFDETTGGHFMLGVPDAGRRLERERINPQGPGNTDHQYELFSIYTGMFVAQETPPRANSGVVDSPIWPELDDPDVHKWQTASSWIYPFGTGREALRTLVAGPVYVRFLRYGTISGHNTTDDSGNYPFEDPDARPTWAQGDRYEYRSIFNFMFQSDFDSDKNLPIDTTTMIAGKTGTPELTLAEIFQDYDDYLSAIPWETGGTLPPNTVPLIKLFDYMKYDGPNAPYPDVFTLPSLAETSNSFSRFHVPAIDSDSENELQDNGYQPHTNFAMFFDKNKPLDETTENCYFYGDLTEIKSADALMKAAPNGVARVTHILNLTGVTDINEENARLQNYLFRPAIIDGEERNVPVRTGIFYILRRNDAQAPLSITNRTVHINKPFIVIVNRGGVKIDYDMTSPRDTDGVPINLMSIVVRNADIHLGGSSIRRIDGYLAAISGQQSIGRLLNDSGLISFEIYGGLALQEIGRDGGNTTTMSDFPNGGIIRYNPGFNASGQGYQNAHFLVVEDGINITKVVPGT